MNVYQKTTLKSLAFLFIFLIESHVSFAQSGSQTICADQVLPDDYVVTNLTYSNECTFSGQGSKNTLTIQPAAPGLRICSSISYPSSSTAFKVPEGFIVSGLAESNACAHEWADSKNSLILDIPSSGVQACGKYPISSTYSLLFSAPEGFMVSAIGFSSSCSYSESISMNTLTLDAPSSGLRICGSFPVSTTESRYNDIPEGFIVSGISSSSSCSFNEAASKNTLIVSQAASGLQACGSYPLSSTRSRYIDIPEGYVVSSLKDTNICDYTGAANKNTLVLDEPSSGLQTCGSFPVSTTITKRTRVPQGFVVTSLASRNTCAYTGSAIKNTLILDAPYPGSEACGSYPVSSSLSEGIILPSGFVVSGLTSKSACSYSGDSNENTLILDTPYSGSEICTSFPVNPNLSREVMLPEGFAVSQLTSNALCDYSNAADKNALILVTPSPGLQVCGSYPIFFNSSFSPNVPDGYVITSLDRTSQCEHDVFEPTKNTLTLELPSSNLNVCGSFPSNSQGGATVKVPDNYVVTDFFNTDSCSFPLDAEKNTLKLMSPTDGINMCISYPHVNNVYTNSVIPVGFSVSDNINTAQCSHLFDLTDNTSILQAENLPEPEPEPETYEWLIPIISFLLQ